MILCRKALKLFRKTRSLRKINSAKQARKSLILQAVFVCHFHVRQPRRLCRAQSRNFSICAVNNNNNKKNKNKPKNRCNNALSLHASNVTSKRSFSLSDSEWEYFKNEVISTRDEESFIERLLPDKLEFYGGVLYHMVKMARNPDETSRLYAAEAIALEKGSEDEIEFQVQTLLSNPSMKQLYDEKYFANLYNLDLNRLKSMPDGTLGREYVRFLETYGLSHYFMRNQFSDYRENPISYFIIRYYEIHDLTHVLLDYNPSAHEEVAINAFNLAQGFVLPARYVLVLGQGFKCLTRYYEELPHYMSLVSEAYQRGKQSEMLLGIKIENYFECQLSELRTKWNIPPKLTKPTLTKDFESETDKYKDAKSKGVYTVLVGPEPQ